MSRRRGAVIRKTKVRLATAIGVVAVVYVVLWGYLLEPALVRFYVR